MPGVLSKDVAKKSAIITITGVGAYYTYRKLTTKRPQRSRASPDKNNGRPKKVAVNREFFIKLLKILRIVIPSPTSREAILIAIHSIFLLLRTYASVYMAVLDGEVVKALVSGKGKEFMTSILKWIVVGVPIAFVNSVIKYLEKRIATRFRTQLTRYVHDKYMENQTYYRVENMDSRINNPDQCITEDVNKLCNSIAELWSNLAKPTIDLIIYNYKLGVNVGWLGLAAVTAMIHTGTVTLRFFTPGFGKLIAEEQKFEGNFRFAHSRIITNSEEIAFYNGAESEKVILGGFFDELLKHVKVLHLKKLYYGILESYIIKYYWGALGYIICALPVFGLFGEKETISTVNLSSRTKDFITNKKLLVNTSDAFGRIMESAKEISELAGYTHRVAELLKVFDDMKNENYQKGKLMLENGLQKNGKVVDSKDINVKDVSIVSPIGDILVKNLSFDLPHGTHVFIGGPNGCGKSSLFRIIGGLWPVYEGEVQKPLESGKIFYIPQRPYLVLGSLRDQIIYPDNFDAMKKKKKADRELYEILETVSLEYLVEREGGFDSQKNWKDVLSGGEKQRIAMARLFYHKPLYAILDECTSAVSIDVEGQIYQAAKDQGISLCTVSHRQSLLKYHDFRLQFDGQGGYEFTPMEVEEKEEKEEVSNENNNDLHQQKEFLSKRINEDQQRLNKILELTT